MKLQEAIKGMQVESWEAREHSSGNGPLSSGMVAARSGGCESDFRQCAGGVGRVEG